MTEIPEHLLKRSRERRAAGGESTEGGAAPAATPAVAATPAAPAAAAPAAAAKKPEPVVKPDPPYVKAAKERHKIPYWAMGTLSLLPVFLFMYWRGMTKVEEVVEGPIGNGAEIYSNVCSGCHGADGGGGVGRQLSEGEVMATFPAINDQMNFIWMGTDAFAAAGLPFYGDAERAHLYYNGAPMPSANTSFQLSQLEVLEVACYIRYELSGADPAGDYATEYEEWCSPEAPNFLGFEDGSLTFDTPELGIGTAARPAIGAPAAE